MVEVGVRTTEKGTHSESIIRSTSDSSGNDAHSTPYEAPAGLTTGRSARSASGRLDARTIPESINQAHR